MVGTYAAGQFRTFVVSYFRIIVSSRRTRPLTGASQVSHSHSFVASLSPQGDEAWVAALVPGDPSSGPIWIVSYFRSFVLSYFRTLKIHSFALS